MDVLEFQEQLERQIDKLKIPADCHEDGPCIESTHPPLTWQIEWILRFGDHKHIRVWEYWDRVAGLQISRRSQFSYHYGGGDGPVRDERGRLDANQPVTLRIDTDGGNAHAHIDAREPHIPQSELVGTPLESVDLVGFIKAIIRARKEEKHPCEVLKIRRRN